VVSSSLVDLRFERRDLTQWGPGRSPGRQCIFGIFEAHRTAHRKGATENVGVENAGVAKMQGWKSREWKTQHQNAGVENAGLTSMESQIYGYLTLLEVGYNSQ